MSILADSVSHHLPTGYDGPPLDPDLAFLAERWPRLQPEIRAGIIALVKASVKDGRR